MTTIERISSHPIRAGAVQDLLNSEVSVPIIMLKGRFSKADTARYLEYI